jgi:predicted nucleic acid-binding protein
MDTRTVCIDTDILIDHLRGSPEATQAIERLEEAGLTLSTTTVNAYELSYGAWKTREPEANLEAVETLLERLSVYPLSLEAALEAGRDMAHLERRGTPVEIRDILIGATAKENGAALYTRNTRHFENIPGLTLHRTRQQKTPQHQ